MPTLATKATTLFSLGAFKTWLGVTDSSRDAILVQIADAISERIESVTGRIFVTRTITEQRSGDGDVSMLLRRFPVTAIASLTMLDTPDQVTPTPYIAGTDFDLNGVTGEMRFRAGRFKLGFQNVAITYTAGWGAQDAAALPQDVYEAGLNYAKAELDEFTTGAIAASSVSIGPASFVLKPGLPPGIKSVLSVWTVHHL